MLRRSMLAWLAGIGACGGGSSSIALHGDSVPSGLLQVPPAPYSRLPRPPAVLLADMLGCPVHDYSHPGMLVSQHQPGEGDLAVLWYGGADAVLGTDPAEYERQLSAIARRCVIVGTYDHPHPPFSAASAAINAAARRAAAACGVPFVDLRTVPVVFADPMHVDQATATAFCSLVASAVKEAMP
jgi:hypothetical protein